MNSDNLLWLMSLFVVNEIDSFTTFKALQKEDQGVDGQLEGDFSFTIYRSNKPI